MWKIVEHNCEDGTWIEHTRSDDDVQLEAVSAANPDSIRVWEGSLPLDVESRESIVQQLLELNQGKVRAVVLGVIHDRDPLNRGDIQSLCGGPGNPNCFCVIEVNRRGCETIYPGGGNYGLRVNCGPC